MLGYRWFLVASDHLTRSRLEYRAKDDAEAIEFARELYALYMEANPGDFGFELWQRLRLVLKDGPYREATQDYTILPGQSNKSIGA
jgi:hypothetical protein